MLALVRVSNLDYDYKHSKDSRTPEPSALQSSRLDDLRRSQRIQLDTRSFAERDSRQGTIGREGPDSREATEYSRRPMGEVTPRREDRSLEYDHAYQV